MDVCHTENKDADKRVNNAVIHISPSKSLRQTESTPQDLQESCEGDADRSQPNSETYITDDALSTDLPSGSVPMEFLEDSLFPVDEMANNCNGSDGVKASSKKIHSHKALHKHRKSKKKSVHKKVSNEKSEDRRDIATSNGKEKPVCGGYIDNVSDSDVGTACSHSESRQNTANNFPDIQETHGADIILPNLQFTVNRDKDPTACIDKNEDLSKDTSNEQTLLQASNNQTATETEEGTLSTSGEQCPDKDTWEDICDVDTEARSSSDGIKGPGDEREAGSRSRWPHLSRQCKKKHWQFIVSQW